MYIYILYDVWYMVCGSGRDRSGAGVGAGVGVTVGAGWYCMSRVLEKGAWAGCLTRVHEHHA